MMDAIGGLSGLFTSTPSRQKLSTNGASNSHISSPNMRNDADLMIQQVRMVVEDVEGGRMMICRRTMSSWRGSSCPISLTRWSVESFFGGWPASWCRQLNRLAVFILSPPPCTNVTIALIRMIESAAAIMTRVMSFSWEDNE